MRFAKIPYSYDWNNIIYQMNNDEEFDTMNIEQDMIALINNPDTVWIEIPDDCKMITSGLYVTNPEEYHYTIIYNGEIVLSFS